MITTLFILLYHVYCVKLCEMMNFFGFSFTDEDMKNRAAIDIF